ncbi:dienelactone hydrolase family protein [Halocella sp. SP3-1]|uniref:dienelactone hydrolase family protein n=1 Tax=Halocella sp. SP3-1 TaxID=2382161 RepID=UPI002570147E|nr:dienelactone hydrolase family protein [Halocella sp. SP3-1]
MDGKSNRKRSNTKRWKNMLTYYNNSNVCVVVLHEIYGVNQHIKTMCKYLADYEFDVLCPNLLQTDDYYDYTDEKSAYHNFKENIGFSVAEKKIKKLLSKIRDKYKFIILVGFSIGATIAWLCSNDEYICDLIIGYYGSRIRDYTEVTPKCPVMLFFPKREKSFNIDNLIEQLKDNRSIIVRQFQADHGFSDPYSDKYCKDSAKKAEQEMIEFIQNYIN